jgi:hypothetical protein
MRIRWENILVPVLIILLIVLMSKMPAFLDRLLEDSSTHYGAQSDPVHHLMIAGLICVTLVSIAKIIWGDRR